MTDEEYVEALATEIAALWLIPPEGTRASDNVAYYVMRLLKQMREECASRVIRWGASERGEHMLWQELQVALADAIRALPLPPLDD